MKSNTSSWMKSEGLLRPRKNQKARNAINSDMSSSFTSFLLVAQGPTDIGCVVVNFRLLCHACIRMRLDSDWTMVCKRLICDSDPTVLTLFRTHACIFCGRLTPQYATSTPRKIQRIHMYISEIQNLSAIVDPGPNYSIKLSVDHRFETITCMY